jgi:hypothetical protein
MKRFMIVLCVAALVGLASTAAQASVTIDVYASSAPNVGASPSWPGYLTNALNSLENGLGTTGNPTLDPTAYAVLGTTVQPGQMMVTSFNSWLGVANPGSPFQNEFGNRLHFGLHAYSTDQKFVLNDLTFAIQSSDANVLGYTGDFVGYNYSSTRIGIDYVDGIKGNGNDIVYTSGNGLTPVNEIDYVGVGNAYWPGGDDPNPANPAGGAQAAMDAAVAYIDSNYPLSVTGTYWIGEATGSATVTTTPEPCTLAIWSLLGGIGAIVGYRRRKAALAA